MTSPRGSMPCWLGQRVRERPRPLSPHRLRMSLRYIALYLQRSGCGERRSVPRLTPWSSTRMVQDWGKAAAKWSTQSWKALVVKPRECAKEAVTRGRFDSSIKRAILDLVRHGRHGWHATRRHATPDNGQQAHPTCISGQHLAWRLWCAVVELMVQEGRQVRLKLAYGFWTFFTWDGRGRVGFPPSA
jgi:hypothetical protein